MFYRYIIKRIKEKHRRLLYSLNYASCDEQNADQDYWLPHVRRNEFTWSPYQNIYSLKTKLCKREPILAFEQESAPHRRSIKERSENKKDAREHIWGRQCFVSFANISHASPCVLSSLPRRRRAHTGDEKIKEKKKAFHNKGLFLAQLLSFKVRLPRTVGIPLENLRDGPQRGKRSF